MDINAYLAKQYESPPCWNLVADYYTAEMGQAVDAFCTVNRSIRAIASAFRLAIHKNPNGFKQISEPVEGCIALLGKTEKLGMHHCGLWIDGRILHALDSGNRYQELSEIADEYKLIEFWAKPAEETAE